MQIPSTGDGRSTGLVRQVHSSHTSAGAAAQTGNSRPLAVDGVEVVGRQADQIQSLVSRLKDVPASRDEVVEAVRSRLQQGDYETRDAAERTSARILGR